MKIDRYGKWTGCENTWVQWWGLVTFRSVHCAVDSCTEDCVTETHFRHHLVDPDKEVCCVASHSLRKLHQKIKVKRHTRYKAAVNKRFFLEEFFLSCSVIIAESTFYDVSLSHHYQKFSIKIQDRSCLVCTFIVVLWSSLSIISCLYKRYNVMKCLLVSEVCLWG